MIEFETTYLAKYLPEGLENCRQEEMLDIYLPSSAWHPDLRIRKKGDKYEITRKRPIGDDPSIQRETTIELSQEEYNEMAELKGKRTHKIRYKYPYAGLTAEIDVLLDDLAGLVVVDFEFTDKEEKDNFSRPDFCLIDVTREDFLAGGLLAGKKYSDIENDLNRLGYQKINIE